MPEEARANSDPQIQAAWEALLQEGESSTVEDVIARINAKRC